jgi:hypothetical protein
MDPELSGTLNEGMVANSCAYPVMSRDGALSDYPGRRFRGRPLGLNRRRRQRSGYGLAGTGRGPSIDLYPAPRFHFEPGQGAGGPELDGHAQVEGAFEGLFEIFLQHGGFIAIGGGLGFQR